MMHKKLKITAIVLVAILILCCGAVGIYAADYYRMDLHAAQAMLNDEAVDVSQYTGSSNYAEFVPKHPKAGFIFYPGGKVEYTAYAPLMRALAEQDILCVIPKMPLNLAVLDMDAADKILRLYPEIDTWYIGGHSLGGSMAASYAAESDDFTGLILLASYSTADLTETDLDVLSIYGTEDGVLNMEKYEEYRSNLPDNTLEHIIDGGNHAQFGSYGAQDGDGIAQVSSEEQLKLTVEAIMNLLS
ncbi:MAG: alpha/beta hydrolase [Oscillospiraceae bacterium]|nr:alpha/beta hydrolase [Oscillospiraceae bacterium]